MAKKRVKKAVRTDSGKSEMSEEDETRLFAFLAAFLSIVGFLIAFFAKRDNEYVMFYAKQSLIVFIVAVIAAIINAVLAWIPIVGTIIMVVLNVFVAVLWVFSWVYAISGKEKEVPIFGEYANKINFK